jgi:hypothetical protein
MKIDIETLVDDQEVKDILCALESIERGGDKKVALDTIGALFVTHEDGTKPGPHEIIRVLVNDYAGGVIELAELKNEIFSILDEHSMLKKVV